MREMLEKFWDNTKGYMEIRMLFVSAKLRV